SGLRARERLALGGREPESLELDHFLLAVADVEVPALVDVADVAAVVPAVAKGRRRRLRRPPVALHDLRPANADLPDLARCEDPLAGLDVDHLLGGALRP